MIVILLVAVVLIAVIAYYKQKLTLSGMIAALFVGSLIAFSLQIYGLLLLGIFFVTSTFLGSLRSESNRLEITAKGEKRDAIQVLANGGVSALFAGLYYFIPSPLLLCGFVGSLAAANSDTWASEIGSFSKNRPFHIIKRKRVDVGTSGAITALGTAAAFAGSFVIVVFAILFWSGSFYNSHILLITLTLIGFISHFIDSLLGAMYQVKYRCPACELETEQTRHCGQSTEKIEGTAWVNNDVVNLACTSVGALLGLLVGVLLF
ncbi:DUF92 domain-containing protein [Halalkalibacter krulwichiae]|uniref:DUF92 domain-containing protein n=1 Tax=Halalkalibacter krulwichiae TaxID=199441 RepID=A0A1X9M9P3_9BACI|nr:DUF92 domain-containing protein [Halalkalibacter krulwichiae]ARK29384.1 hypothetical protein BkAM31D_05700 [Halalkalibacter krulwichiae]